MYIDGSNICNKNVRTYSELIWVLLWSALIFVICDNVFILCHSDVRTDETARQAVDKSFGSSSSSSLSVRYVVQIVKFIAYVITVHFHRALSKQGCAKPDTGASFLLVCLIICVLKLCQKEWLWSHIFSQDCTLCSEKNTPFVFLHNFFVKSTDLHKNFSVNS